VPRKIGIVDDSATIRTAFQFTFAGDDLGLEAHLFASADEALKSGEKLDLLYVDTKLAGEDGYQACARLRSAPAFAATPIVMIFGPWETYDEARGRGAGAVGAIPKPWESEDMIVKVQGFLTATPPAVTAGAAAAPARPAAAPAPAAPPARPVAPGAPLPPPSGQRIPTQIAVPGRPGIAPVPPPHPPTAAAMPARPASAPAAPVRTPLAPTPLADFAQAAAPAVGRDLAHKLAAEVPGLTPEQLQAVVKLVSREIVEQVAWEVVPDLAEAIIREQIQALLKE